MLRTLAYYNLFGLPLVAYLGMLTLAAFLFAALIAILNGRFNIHVIPFKWHPRVALCAIFLAFIHAIFAFTAYV